MLKTKLLVSREEYTECFAKCCNQFSNLDMAVAWCGNPALTLPHRHIEKIKGNLRATIGYHFNQTHPDSIEILKKRKAKVKLFDQTNGLFHPKIYLFYNEKKYVVFIGSSNFTYSGFYGNVESNVMISGNYIGESGEQYKKLKDELDVWHSSKYSFVPTDDWVENYRKDYKKSLDKRLKAGLKGLVDVDQEITKASWINKADWDTYFEKVTRAIDRRPESEAGYRFVLESAIKQLPNPWNIGYLDNMESRKLIGGRGGYGWFGNTVASGKYAHLLKGGEAKHRQLIVKVVNQISVMTQPLDYGKLRECLEKLVGLGFTMKVWGRVLMLARPDLFCTVCSDSLRKNLSKSLAIPQKQFETAEGYLSLIKYLHASPWFRANRPRKKLERYIWDNRMALVDPIFY